MIILLATMSVGLKTATSQEAVRLSLAGADAAAARRKATSFPDRSNLQLGPTLWDIRSALDLEANDNIRFTSVNRTFDMITRPQLMTRVLWPVSERNGLNLALGSGYSFYAGHPEYNRFFIAPGSELSFDLYAGDIWVNLHERVSITENGYEDPTVFGTGDYSQFQNTAGFSAAWDLNHCVLRFGYDHAHYFAITGGAGVPDGNSDTLFLSAGYRWKPEMTFGLETGGGWIRYDSPSIAAADATDWNLGTFIETRPTEYLKIRAAAGYTIYVPESGSADLTSSQFTGAYARLGLTHRINQYVDYVVSGGRSINFGFFSGTIDMYTAVFESRWHLFQKLSLGTGFEFEHGSQVLSGQGTFDRFGPRLSLERPLTTRLSGALRYQYYQRQSDPVGGEYEVNIVTINLAYRL